MTKRTNNYEYPAWYNNECIKAKKDLQHALKNCRTTNWDPTIRDNYIQQRKNYKKLLQLRKKLYWENKIKEVADSANLTQFWKSIKFFRKSTSIPNTVEKHIWETYMAPAEQSSTYLAISDTRHEFLDQQISVIEYNEAVKHIKNGKAAGPDEITNEFLKNLPASGGKLLCTAINKIFSSEEPPADWSEFETCMIFKKGDAENPENYRPIALANTTMKLFTHIIERRLRKWAENNKLLPEAQAGFRAGRGCIDHIHTLNSAIQIALNDNNGKLYALFIDFKQAFPSIDHNLLWKTLNDIGTSGKIIRILQNLYAKASTKVRVE
ncbi:unnamed protein product, partial [Allacma fusca]